MFPTVGPGEIIVILVLALLFFGPKKLPDIGKSIGNAMREFRKASSDFMDAVNNPHDEQDYTPPPVKNIDDTSMSALATGSETSEQPYGSDFYTPDPLVYADAAPYVTEDSRPWSEGESTIEPANQVVYDTHRDDSTPDLGEASAVAPANTVAVSEGKA